MPHTEGAKKRLRQNEKRRLRNKATKKAIKLSLRPFDEPATDVEQLKKDGRVAVRLLDKAASKGRIHANKAGAQEIADRPGAEQGRDGAGRPGSEEVDEAVGSSSRLARTSRSFSRLLRDLRAASRLSAEPWPSCVSR